LIAGKSFLFINAVTNRWGWALEAHQWGSPISVPRPNLPCLPVLILDDFGLRVSWAAESLKMPRLKHSAPSLARLCSTAHKHPLKVHVIRLSATAGSVEHDPHSSFRGVGNELLN
jgi:hypothetical protein